MDIPFTYLDVPIGTNPNHSQTWQPVMKKFKKKLSAWNNRNLPIGEDMPH